MRLVVIVFGRTNVLPETVRVDANVIHRHDLSVGAFAEVGAISSVQVTGSSPIDGAGVHSRIRGQLLDAATGGTIQGAEVTLAETALRTVSDAGGRFQFDSVPSQLHSVSVSRLGYSEQAVRLEVPVARSLDVEIRLGADAVQLAGIDVDVRRPLLASFDEHSSRVVAGAKMAEHERRGSYFEDIARAHFPLHVAMLDGSVCIESRRVSRSVSSGARLPCAMVPLYVDDVRVYNAGEYLFQIRAESIESAIYLSPGETGLKYGPQAQSLGVILLYTRTNGPIQSPERDVRRQLRVTLATTGSRPSR